MTDASRRRAALGGTAALACAVAAALVHAAWDPRPAPGPAARAPGPPAPLSRAAAGVAPRAEPPPAPSRRAPVPPRFDVVRMGARGTVVVAGRADPGAEVVLIEGGREIGRGRADARGEWVILPGDPLGAGARELSLRARSQDGQETAGPDTVLVVGPEPGESRPTQHAARPAPRDAAPSAGGADADPRAGMAAGDAASPARAADQPLVLLLPPTAAAAPRALSPRPGGDAAVLGLDVVDYDGTSAMRFAGTAPPGARLRVYADDRHLGDAAADAAGRWSLTPAVPPAVGRHTLRVDSLAAGAAVLGRIEVAFQREATPPGAVRDGRVVVQPGNNLWRIAREAYGSGTRYTVIYRANGAAIRDPGRIWPGQVFSVPDLR